MDDIIREFGGAQSAKVVFRGKIISVEHSLSSTAHTTGKVVLQQLSPDELGVGDMEVSHGPERVVVEFVNENLSAKGIYSDGSEEVTSTACLYVFLM